MHIYYTNGLELNTIKSNNFLIYHLRKNVETGKLKIA